MSPSRFLHTCGVMIDRRLLALALSAFVVAVDGTLVIGLLGRIAAGVHASTAAAGQSVTAFALAYAALAPALVALTRRWPQPRLLVAALALFVVANLATAFATSLAWLLAARAIAGASAGVLTPTAAGIAVMAVPPHQRGRALAVVVGGASVAAVAGVPLGTLVGIYFGWRVAFFAAAALCAALFALLATTDWPDPRYQPSSGTPSPFAPIGVALTLLVTLLWAFGSFTFFSYLSLVTHKTASAGGTGVAIYLLVFGITGVAGALVSGRITDARGPVVAAGGALLLVATALAGLALLAAIAHRVAIGISLTATLIAAYGLGTWGITPAQQHRLITAGGPTRLLLSLNASALYAGVAIGATVGGAVLTASGSVAALCATAAGLQLAAFFVLATAARLRNHRRPHRVAPPPIENADAYRAFIAPWRRF
jgi:DHA1 family inner membrane transport protein